MIIYRENDLEIGKCVRFVVKVIENQFEKYKKKKILRRYKYEIEKYS